jgi:putative ABC transport system permease protein
VSALGKKRRRDLWRLKGQVVTIALVLACGMMTLIMMRSSYSSLLEARDTYYTEYRFADVFARLQRAPDRVARELEAIPGVANVYTRVAEDVMVPLADEPDPVTGRIISLPDAGAPPLNELYLRAGRLPTPGATDEIVILEKFAEVHAIHAGDRLPTVIDGRLRQLAVVGLAMSPEYVLAMSERTLMFDSRTFVVIWMPRAAVAAAFRMEGAFDDVTIAVEPSASEPGVLDAVDRVLAPYGGFHAVTREHQSSNFLLTSRLDTLQSLAVVVPLIFLAVAAFLVNVVVSRLVFLERTEIAVLKALGYSNRQIGLHYLALVAWIVGIGAVLGIALGVWFGRWMTALYADFYRFPTKLHHVSVGVIALAIAIGLAAAVTGALASVYRVVRMPPAQAMRPPTPLVYRRSLLERLGLRHVVGPSTMMVVREIERRPVRFLMSTAGIAMGLGIFIFGRFSLDSFDHLMSDTFLREHREDMTLTFNQSMPDSVVGELEHVPGVERAEGQHVVAVRFHAGSRWRDSTIIADAAPSALRQHLDHGTTPFELPEEGLVLTDRLAMHLGVHPGEALDVEIYEGSWPKRRMIVAGTVDEAFGLQAHARTDWLERTLGEQPRVTGALLKLAPGGADRVRAELKQMPAVLGVISTQHIIDSYREQTGQSMVVVTLILGLSAAAIAVGVIYNNARIALSLRSRDLASLRVLGFTRREISTVLIAELGVQVAIGIPLGLMFGSWLATVYARTIDQDFIRFPLHIATRTFAGAASIALVSGVVSALLVRRKLDRLDLLSVLKSE